MTTSRALPPAFHCALCPLPGVGRNGPQSEKIQTCQAKVRENKRYQVWRILAFCDVTAIDCVRLCPIRGSPRRYTSSLWRARPFETGTRLATRRFVRTILYSHTPTCMFCVCVRFLRFLGRVCRCASCIDVYWHPFHFCRSHSDLSINIFIIYMK